MAIRDYSNLELGSAHGGVSMRAHRHASRSATGGRTGVGAAMHAVSTVPVTGGRRMGTCAHTGLATYGRSDKSSTIKRNIIYNKGMPRTGSVAMLLSVRGGVCTANSFATEMHARVTDVGTPYTETLLRGSHCLTCIRPSYGSRSG